MDYDPSSADYDSNYEDDLTRDYSNDYRTTAHNSLSTPKSSDNNGNNGKLESSATADKLLEAHQLTADSSHQKNDDFAAKIKRSVALGKLDGSMLRKRHKVELGNDSADSEVESEDLNNFKELYEENFKGESSHRAQKNRTSPLKLRLREDVVAEEQSTTHKSVDHFT